MNVREAIAFLAEKDNTPDALRAALRGRAADAYVSLLFGALGAENKRARNRAAKLIARESEANPSECAAKLPELAAMAAGEGGSIILWNALIAIGRVAGAAEDADIKRQVKPIVERLADESMVTAGHAVRCLGRIAAAKSDLRTRVVKALSGVDSQERGEGCRNILVGKTLEAFEDILAAGGAPQREAMRAFAARHQDNPRAAVARRARRLARAMEKSRGLAGSQERVHR